MKRPVMKTLWDLLPTRRRSPAKPRQAPRPAIGVVARKPGPKKPPTTDRMGIASAPGTRIIAPRKAPARGLVVTRTAAPPAAGLRLSSPRRETMADKYRRIEREMLARYGVRVRKWRSSMSGVAWQVTYHDGSVARLIEAPRPKGPMSAAVFLHEIGHHAIGFDVYRNRCLEEFHAWRFALETMEAEGLNVTPAVRERMAESLWYALFKAKRRGLRVVPPELRPYETVPERFRGTA